jgi:hypothetical protein
MNFIPTCGHIKENVATNQGIQKIIIQVCPGDERKIQLKSDEFAELCGFWMGKCASWPNCSRLNGRTKECKEQERSSVEDGT